MRKGGIYGIKNKVNGKLYIGSTYYFKARFGCHRSLLRSNKHTNKHLQYAWNKYGQDNLEFFIIEELTDKNMFIPREQFYIDHFNSHKIGYNMKPNADSSIGYTYQRKEEHIMRGKRHPMYGKKGINNPSFGRRNTKDAILQMSISKLGSKNAMFGKFGDKHHLSKPVLQILDQAIIREWTCLHEIERVLKYNKGNISQCCTGKRNSAHGYKWRYKK
jgi:group I intron endonuclease